MPEWQIKCWDSQSFDFDSVPYVREAIAAKKWAFASDYVRLHALYSEGGVYLDSDVQAWGSINDFLEYDFFTGLEMRDKDHLEIYPEAAIMGSVKNNPLVASALKLYESCHFQVGLDRYDLTPIPTRIKPLFYSIGWEPEDRTQVLENNAVVFCTDIIANTNCERKSTVKLYHLNNRSWIPLTAKEKLLRRLADIGILPVIKRVIRGK